MLQIRTVLAFGKEGGVVIERKHKEDFSDADNVLFLYQGYGYLRSGYLGIFTLLKFVVL